MRKRTIRNLFRRRLPTRPLNSAAGDGKCHTRVCRVIPSAWIRSVRPPCCRTGAVPEQGGGSLLPQAPRCYIPDPSAHLDAEEGIGHDLSGIPLSPHLRLAGSGESLNRAMGYGHKKRARKVPPVPDRLKQQTFRTLK